MSSLKAFTKIFRCSNTLTHWTCLASQGLRPLPFVKCGLQQFSSGTTGCCQTVKLKEKRFAPRRAVLYVPGNDERKLIKVPSLDVDCAVMDCEDGVAINRKVEARETIKKMLDELEFGRTECCVRVNAVSSGLMEEDLKVILQAKTLPETIMIPKVNSSQELAAITHSVHSHLKTRDLQHKISLVLFTESAIGLLNLQDICNRATEISLRSNIYQVDGLVFGSDDFCADIDKDALKDQSIKGANMGFTGKQVIHPSQIPIVQEAFAPSTEQIEWATALIQAFEEHQNSGKGAFTFRGHMIDMPLLLQAQNIMNLSNSIQSTKS